MTVAILGIIVFSILLRGGIWFEAHFAQLQESICKREQQHDATRNAAEPTNSPDDKGYWFRIFHRRKSIIAKPEPSEGQHRQAEQDFWRRALAKQRNLNIFTCLGVLAAAAAFVVLKQTLNESKTASNYSQIQASAAASQAQIAQREFELSERPWVYAENIELIDGLTYDINGARITLRFWLKNVGHSPAIGTWVNVEPLPVISDLVIEQKRYCDQFRTYKADPHAIGDTIFPDQVKIQTQTITIGRKDLDTLIETWTKTIRKSNPHVKKFVIPFTPAVVGCVDYRFPFASGHHQTPIILQLSGVNSKYPNGMFVLEPYKRLRSDQVRLFQWIEAGGDAD